MYNPRLTFKQPAFERVLFSDMTPVVKAQPTAHQTFARITQRPCKIQLPCGRLTKPIDPVIAQRLAAIAKVSQL